MGIANIINNSTTTSGGEIVRELVNSTDGAGLHFDGGSPGYIDIASPPDLGTKFSFEFIFKASTWISGDYKFLLDFGGGSGRFIIGTNNSDNNLKIFDNVGYKDTGVVIFDDLDVHHVVVTVNGTSALVYDNGNQVGSATISASHGIDTATDAAIATNIFYSSNNAVTGTLYRCRFYNKALSSAEVQTAYQRADVPFADQYGEQNLVDAAASAFTSGTYSWVAYGSNTIANVSNDLTISYGGNSSGAYNYLRDSFDLKQDLVIGENYRLRMRAKYAGGASGVTIQVYDGSSTIVADSALTTSFVDYEIEFTAQSITDRPFVFFTDLKSGNVVTIDTWQVDQVGCVSDYDLAFANENQSRMVADRSTNNVDGEMSSSGVKQTQVIKQLNSTAMRVGTPAATPGDGEIISSGKISANAKVNINSNGTLDWGNAADYGVLTWGGTTDAIVRGAASKNLKLGANNQNFVTINTSGNVGVGDETPTSPGGAARFVEISGTSASLVLTDSDAATWEWISAGGNLKAAKDGSDYLSIDSSGNVNVDGGGYVKIAPADTQAELRLYRDDATINTSGIAIGDINFGGADADNDNAARLRVKSDGAWTSTSSPTAFEFQTCPSGSESPQTRLVIDSDGLCTFSNGITVSGGSTNIGSGFPELTISSGAITVTDSTHRVDTESDSASDDLDTINGGAQGSILTLRSMSAARDVTVKDATGNIYLAGDFALSHSQRFITLIKYGGGWYELSRSANA